MSTPTGIPIAARCPGRSSPSRLRAVRRPPNRANPEEYGKPGTGLLAHHAPQPAWKLRKALVAALRDIGEEPDGRVLPNRGRLAAGAGTDESGPELTPGQPSAPSARRRDFTGSFAEREYVATTMQEVGDRYDLVIVRSDSVQHRRRSVMRFHLSHQSNPPIGKKRRRPWLNRDQKDSHQDRLHTVALHPRAVPLRGGSF